MRLLFLVLPRIRRAMVEAIGGNGNGKFDITKMRINEDYSIVSEDGFKGVNTVFTKPIHKILYDI